MKKLLPVLCSFSLLASSLAVRAVVPITVVSTADSGPGSLREAIATAPSGSTIDFAVTGAIVLTSGELLIDKDLVIAGPGPGVLAVQRSTAAGTPDFRIFHLIGGSTVISGLTVSNGRDLSGGGILNEDSLAGEMLVLRNMVISGNVVTNVS